MTTPDAAEMAPSWIRYGAAFIAIATWGMPAHATPPSLRGTCYEIYLPVCGTRDGQRVTYDNQCYARRDGATDIANGRCPPGK